MAGALSGAGGRYAALRDRGGADLNYLSPLREYAQIYVTWRATGAASRPRQQFAVSPNGPHGAPRLAQQLPSQSSVRSSSRRAGAIADRAERAHGLPCALVDVEGRRGATLAAWRGVRSRQGPS